MNCIFCKIINGDIQSKIVAESSNYIAIKDINPVAPVHILIIPKEHIEKPGELAKFDGKILQELFELVEEVARSENIFDNGYRLIVNSGKDAGQEVSHLHWHLLGGRKLGKLG